MNNLQIEGVSVEAEPLGRGCSGEVFKAQYESSHDAVVAKRYNPMSIDRQLMEEMLYRQRNTTEHDGIVPLLDFRFDKTPYYSVARFENGKCLKNASLFDDSQARDLIRGMADAMGHAHQFGLLHGNLHPGNVFYHFDDDLNVKASISDFAAGMIGEVHYVDLGETAYFAAPEQLQCLGADYKFGNAERWDVYRFGAIAFWIINRTIPRGIGYREYRARQISESGGRPVPVDPIALAESMHSEAELPWAPLQHGSQAGRYQTIIENCLALRPADRPRDMQEVIRDIGRLDAEADRVARKQKQARIEKAKRIKIKKAKERAVQEEAAMESGKKSPRARLISWFRPRSRQVREAPAEPKQDTA